MRWAFLLLIALACPLNAERYLTVAEAQKLCFPKASRFDAVVIELAREQIQEIERKTRTKVRNPKPRIWTAWEQTNLLGVLFADEVIGKHDLVDYGLAVSPKGEVLQLEILEYREHYGGQIRRPEWRAQFKGKRWNDSVKLNDDIYNISGATLSCRHVTEGVKRLLVTFELVVRPRLMLDAGVPNKPPAKD